MERRFGTTLVSLREGDLARFRADALVNAANARLAGGGGVDGAIHRAGGPAIMRELDEIRARQGGCPTGDAVATTAGELPARWVVHAVGPVWCGGHQGEDALLASAHRRALEVALGLGARTAAFPAISTGAYGFPVQRAAPVALGAVREVAEARPGALDRVAFMLVSPGDLAVFRDALARA